MGRGKIEVKLIQNVTNRQVTFSKRRNGLIKKANELFVLCDANIALIIFSSSGKKFEYCSPSTSMGQIVERYKKACGTTVEESDDKKMLCELSRMKFENEKLQSTMRYLSGEDLATLTMNDLNQLEQELEDSVNRVQSKKNQLIRQQFENLRRKEHLLEDQNNHLTKMLEHQIAMEPKDQIGPVQLLNYFDSLYDQPADQEQSRPEMLELSTPFQNFRTLQQSQPNVQDQTMIGHHHGFQHW